MVLLLFQAPPSAWQNPTFAMNQVTKYKPLLRAGIFLGIGLGGFLDGIIFHQLLQTHSMLTGRIPKDTIVHYQVNMFWDGVFHAFTWIMTAAGLALLWRSARQAEMPLSGKVFVSAMFLGWGLFNFVEGLLNHHILGLHHVVERLGTSIYDYAFLASGVLFIVGGIFVIRSASRAEEISH